MPYQPVVKVRKDLIFSDLPIGMKFFFHYDLDRHGKATVHLKVSDDSYLRGVAEGVVLEDRFSNLVTIDKAQYWQSPVERCRMLSEEEYQEVTAKYR